MCIRRFEDVDSKEANASPLGKLKMTLGKVKEKLFGSKKEDITEEKKTN